MQNNDKISQEAEDFLSSIFANEEQITVENLQNLIVKNIPFDCRPEEVLEVLQIPPDCISNYKHTSKGYAFLSTTYLPNLENIYLHGRKLIVEKVRQEWHCACGMNNFDSREECMACGVSRWNKGDGDVSESPTSFVILRGLSTNTTSEDIYRTLGGHEGINSVMLVIDKATRQSWCFAFLKFASSIDANRFIKFYSNKELSIDNSVLDVSFASLSAFLPSPTSPYTSYILDDISYTYWDGKAFARSFPDIEIPPLPSIQEYLDSLAVNEVVKEKKQVFIGPVITSRQQRGLDNAVNWKSTNLDDLDTNVDYQLKTIVDKLVPSTAAIDQEFTNLVRVACMLCRRGFKRKGGETGLRRHLEESLMHAQRVRLYKNVKRDEIEKGVKNGDIKVRETRFIQQEDRQKTVQVTRNGIKSDNVGNRMLKMMGWKEGTGLGVNGDGRRENIKVDVDNSRKGIGLRGTIKNGTNFRIKKGK